MEERRGLTIKDLLIRLVLIIVFIVLLIWLFPMPDLKPLNNQIFAENIDRMKDVAKSYYTVERLPKDLNASKKMSLKEMIDGKLILPLMDSNGKYCSEEDSYIQITKLENEYIIKVYLSCSDKQDYIIEHFGCYDICSDRCKPSTSTSATTTVAKLNNTTNTTKKKVVTTKNNGAVYLYEYTKNVCTDSFDKYTCPSGYRLTGSKCIKNTAKTTIVAADKNVKKITRVKEKDAQIISINSNKKEKATCSNVTKTSTIDATKNTTLYEKVYQKTQKVTADKKTSYDVKGAVGTKKTITASYQIIQNYDVITATKVATSYKWTYVSTVTSNRSNLAFTNENEKLVLVDSWEELTCETCFTKVKVYKYFRYKKVVASYGYTCPSGYSKYNTTQCRKATTQTKGCPSGYTDTGSNCKKTEVTYSCSKYGSDYVLDKNKLTCTKTIVSYSCPAGTTKTSDPKYCNKDVYGCPSGTVESNGKCAKTTYSCPTNTKDTTYTLNGTKCTVKKVEEVCKCANGTQPTSDKYCIIPTKSTKYSCDNYPGYTLRGSKCIMNEIDEKVTYSCKKGVLNGASCVITENSSDTINAKANYKTTCKQEYKWSTKTSLDGWTYTGKKERLY